EGFNSSTGGVARFIDVDNEHCRALRVRHDCVLAPGERWTADGVEAWGAFSGGGVFAPGCGKVPVSTGVERFACYGIEQRRCLQISSTVGDEVCGGWSGE